eukprot:TRINITY_DN6164_c0_g1_i1.p1 TRINITY_DN6164_c0_g1~~TRINITY_DN6164_c0_g1_i1.p1  ORF type:complete len:371 (-),score=44.14 TRINITY_DN6164_c0_g1_i1:281-1393(-)
MPFRWIRDTQHGLCRHDSLREIFKRDISIHMTMVVDVKGLPIMMTIPSRVTALDFEQTGGRKLLAASANGDVLLFDCGDYRNIKRNTRFQIDPVSQTKWPRQGRVLASESHKNSIRTIAWYPGDDALFITSGMNSYLCIWDAEAFEPVVEYEKGVSLFESRITPLKCQSPLVAASCENGDIVMYDLRQFHPITTIHGHDGPVYTVDWNPIDHSILATGSADQNIKLWDIRRAHRHLRVLTKNKGQHAAPRKAHSGAVTCVRFAANGLCLYSSGTDHRLLKWDAFTGLHDDRADFPGVLNDSSHNNQFVLNDDGKLLYHRCDGGLGVYDAETVSFTGDQVSKTKNSRGEIESITAVSNGLVSSILYFILFY